MRLILHTEADNNIIFSSNPSKSVRLNIIITCNEDVVRVFENYLSEVYRQVERT